MAVGGALEESEMHPGADEPSDVGDDLVRALRQVGGPFVDALDSESVRQFTRGATLRSVPAGGVIFLDYDEATGIVISGITRTFLRSHDGRQLSVRYARRGFLIGTITGLRRRVARLTVQAVTDCEIVELDRGVFGEVVANNPRVSIASLDEVARRLHELYSVAAINAFGTLRTRIVRQLVDVAQRDPATGVLIAPVTQQAIADAIGTAREVVARSLSAMRREGLIETAKGRIRLVDPDRLAASIAGWTDQA
jgi:CRP/FNR family transcriptional regulator, cyclic AMP receptor protein